MVAGRNKSSASIMRGNAIAMDSAGCLQCKRAWNLWSVLYGLQHIRWYCYILYL